MTSIARFALPLALAGVIVPVAGIAARPARANPFAIASPLPLQAPQFDRIRDADYQPAIEQGMAEQRAEIARIARNPAAPTFDNTIVAIERSGRMLDRANSVFSAITSANSNAVLDKVQAAEAPRLAAHDDAIFLDAALFARVDALHRRRAALALDAEQRQLLDVYHARFVRAGAQLAPADQAKLRALNTALATLEIGFRQKLIAAAKAGALIVDDRAALAGLDPEAIAAAGQAARERGLPGKWVLPLQNTTQQPALASLDDRATRAALFARSWTRTEMGDANDTRAIVAQIAQLRARKAGLFGQPNWASYVLSDQMARTPAAAQAFLARLIPALAAEQRREVADIRQVIVGQGQTFAPKPWDWDYYAEQVRKARYDLDQDQVKPYFELDAVLQKGVFYAATQLYGITFKERKDIPVYQSDVRVFEVFDKDGTTLGLAYFDYFKRDNKSGGAWMGNFVGQSKLLGTRPVIYNVANFTKPAPGQPALISFDDVTTMFHEFGHGLHGLFANQAYPLLSGTNVARDYVEFPSQFNENWALDPQVFAHYARHYRTGAAMPQALADKIKAARKFNQGYALGEAVAAAKLDLDWHSLPATAPTQDVDAFETQALARSGLDIADVPPRYRSSYFLHIWDNGYSASYYAYAWSEMLDHAAFRWFTDHGGLTRANGQRFRDMILSRGRSGDYATMFRAWHGKDPDIDPMLAFHGLARTAD